MPGFTIDKPFELVEREKMMIKKIRGIKGKLITNFNNLVINDVE